MTWTVENASPQLIEPSSTGAAPSATSDMPVEVVFLAGTQTGLHHDGQGRVRELKTRLAHAVARTPGNLRLHVQRLVLHAKSRDPAVLGTHWDLCRVVGERGLPLRRRMLALARPHLSRDDHQMLRQRLGPESRVQSQCPIATRGCVLDGGITGTTRLINKLERPRTGRKNPLESTRQQLDYGQTALAQATLERALRAEPGRLELHLALLETYRHTRNRNHIEAFWQSLQGQVNPATTEWRRLLIQLEEAT